MKILLITLSFPPEKTGASTNYSYLFNYLNRKFNNRYKVNVLTCYKSNYKLIDKINSQYIFRILPPSRKNNNKIIKVILSVFKNVVIFLYLLIFKFYKYDVVHIPSNIIKIRNFTYDNFLIKYILKFNNSNIVLDVRERDTIPYKDNLYDRIIYNSSNIKNRLLNNNFDESKLIRIDSPIFNYNDGAFFNDNKFSKYKPYICFVGSIVEKKGIYELRESFKRIKDSKINLIYIGRPIDNNFINKIKNDPKIYYLGSVNNEESQLCIKNSELLVLPSYNEGLPRVIVEAMYKRKKFLLHPPIIDIKRIFPDLILEKLDIEYLSKKINKVLNMDKNNLYKRNLDILENFSPKVYIEKIKKLYSKIGGR